MDLGRSGVTVTLGDKYRFAAEVGEGDHTLRRVDLWAAGQWLTCDDNMAFVEQFRRAVLDTAAWLRSGGGFAAAVCRPVSGGCPPASRAGCHGLR
jgi:hypothetical protein